MAQQTIPATRQAQRTAGAITNANFTELYARHVHAPNTAKTAAFTFVVPAGYAIEHVFFVNTTANAVTGGLKFGTTSGGTDVVAAQAVGANAVGEIKDASLLKTLFSKTVDQTIYVDAVSAWNSASVDVIAELRRVY